MGAKGSAVTEVKQSSPEPLKTYFERISEDRDTLEAIDELTTSIQLPAEHFAKLNALNTIPVAINLSEAPERADVHPLDSSLFGLKPSPVSLSYDPELTQGGASPRVDISLLDILGEGGMGKVYLGSQASLGREVAIKVAKTDLDDLTQLAQAYHEAQITAALEHPNILPVHLLARDAQGRPVQVMKRIQGITWSELIDDPEHPSWEQLEHPEGQLHFHLNVLAQVSLAVAYAHERGVIHRDLKPSNVMICRFGEVYVLDWGVALSIKDLSLPAEQRVFIAQERCGLASALVGTPIYMPPEMGKCDVEQLGPSTDVYLLGAILYELLCGRSIREGDNVFQIFDQIISGHTPEIPAQLSEEFKTLLELSLCPDPSQRLTEVQPFRRLLIHATQTDRADQLRQRADRARLELESLIQDPPVGSIDLFDRYDEARLDYRACLEMWPTSTRALQGLDLLYALFTEHLIREGELVAARRTLTKLSEPDARLNELIERAERAREHEVADHAQLKSWHRSHDIQRSRSLRIIVTVVGLVCFGLGAILLELLRQAELIEILPRDEVMISLMLSIAAFCVIAFFAFQRRRFSREANSVFARFVGYFVLIMVLVTTQRYISWQQGLSSPQILLQEMPLIVLGSFGLSAIAGRLHFLLGGLSFVVAMLASLSMPEITKMAYSVAMLMVWIIALAWTKTEDKQGPSDPA